MKRIVTLVLGLLIVLMLGTVPAQAQQLLSNTTLSAAITATQTSFAIASASASAGSSFGAPAAGQCLYVDLELMRIVLIASTTVTVQRGTQHRSTHASGATVLTGPCNGMNGGFMAADPPNIGGNQSCTTYTRPWINVNTGADWWCDTTLNSWSVTYPYAIGTTAASRRIAQ